MVAPVTPTMRFSPVVAEAGMLNDQAHAEVLTVSARQRGVVLVLLNANEEWYSCC